MVSQGTVAARRVELLESFQAVDQLAHGGELSGQISAGEWGECMSRTLPELLVPWEQFEALFGLEAEAVPVASEQPAVVHYNKMLNSLGDVPGALRAALSGVCRTCA